MGQRIGGKGRLTEEVGVQAFAVLAADPGGPVQASAGEIGVPDPVAIGRVGARTRFAVAARVIGQDDVIAGLDMGDGRADPLHHPGAFMAEYGRQRRGHQLMLDVGVSRADSGGDHPDQHLVGARLLDDYRADHEGGVLPIHHCGSGCDAHATTPLVWGRPRRAGDGRSGDGSGGRRPSPTPGRGGVIRVAGTACRRLGPHRNMRIGVTEAGRAGTERC